MSQSDVGMQLYNSTSIILILLLYLKQKQKQFMIMLVAMLHFNDAHSGLPPSHVCR